MINKNILNFLILFILLLVLISLGCINKDSDKDGYPDDIDAFPKDYNYHLDSDGDGCADEIDVFPNNSRYQVESDRLSDTSDPEKLFQYGNELLKANNYEQSIKYFDKSLSIRYNETVLNRKSIALFKLHNYESAIECADEVLKNNQNNTSALNVKSRALLQLHYYEDAIECADILLKNDQNNTDALWIKGVALAELGDVNQGIKYIDMAIETDPDNPDNQKLLEIKKKITSQSNILYGNDLTSKIKLDLTKMGYPNSQVKLFDQIKWIEIDIGEEFESTTDSSPNLRPRLEYIAEEIGSSSYVLESGYDTVCVEWKVYWNVKGDGTVGTSAHGSEQQEVYYHVKEAKITYY